MARERLYLFDTTLRDGAQMNGVDFTLHDKLAIAKLLDDLGVDYIEGGYPGANPTDTDLFSEERKLGAARGAKRLTADVSDSAQDFFAKRGFEPTQRNTVQRGGEWLTNTTMEKKFADKGAA